MRYQLSLTKAELEELEQLARREAEASHVEHRRTRNPRFRSDIEERLRRLEHMLELVEEAREHQPA
jgi:hypothetical protein